MGPIERKGLENLAKSGATVVDQSNLGQPPRLGFPPGCLHGNPSSIKLLIGESGEGQADLSNLDSPDPVTEWILRGTKHE